MLEVRKIKVRGKFYVYQFDSKGRIVTRIKWDRKNNSITKSLERLKQNRSIKEGQKRFKLTNFYETVDTNKFDFRKPNKGRPSREYQYFVKVKIGNSIATARSMKHEVSFPVNDARSEAIENAIMRATDYKDGVDPSRVRIISEGFVSYGKV